MASKLAAQPRPCGAAASGIRPMQSYEPLSESDIAGRVRRYNSPEERRRRLLMYLKPADGPWRAEFTRSVCGSAVEAEGLWQGTRRPVLGKEDLPTGLLAAIEEAAAALGFGLRGMYKMGIHEVPHIGLLPVLSSEGLVITKGGLMSPMAVSAEHMLLQCGGLPFVFPYGKETDLRTIFGNTLVPESFF